MQEKNNQSEIIIYEGDDGALNLQVRMENETVWLNQQQMAELFQTSVPNISMHIKNCFNEGELAQNSVIKDFLITASDNKEYNTKHYNLDVVISVGYRVKSHNGTRFRQWATTRLREYLIKGFTMDDKRLKESGGGDYWKELLNRIRDIRSSEKVLYRQVLDLYATSIDYNPESEESIKFFKVVQNKLHYATNQQTAAETIYRRADAEKDFMGLTTFSGAVPNLSEVSIAKNYLTEDELFRLSRLVSAFFDLAEIKAQEHEKMTMANWVSELDKFSDNFGKGVLKDAGSVSHKEAIEKATKEYRKYQAKTLSPVEVKYLESIKAIEKKVVGKGSKKE